ncbi:CRTAC1 family protein [Stappia sediminis]|nr:CRTAC1 family protein [Stappia sediminis]
MTGRMFTRTSFLAGAAFLALTPLSAKADGATLTPLPHFSEEASNAGIDHKYTGPWEFFVGGGAAVFDCSGDRKPDLFVAGGTTRAKLYRNLSSAGGALHFEEVRLDLPERLMEKVTGAYPIDIDNDGIKDLAVMRVGENLLLKGKGDCRFEEANRAWAFDGGRAWSTGFAATFEPDKAFPTLAFGNYVDRSAPGSPWGTCHDNMLYRPRGEGAPDYSDAFALSPGYCSLSMLFTDWNRSGKPALRISNDRQYYRGGEEQLWAVPPGRPPRPYRKADGWQHVKIWGMGIASTDLDGDGFPEYALTSMGDTKLQTLDKESEQEFPIYRDIAFDLGVTAHRPYAGDDSKPSTGWHAQFEDVNNDTLADLFIAKGNVEAMPDFASYDPDNLLVQEWDGTFTERGMEAGVALNRKGRGGGVVDLNMDGLPDILVVNREGPVSLFRNLGGGTKANPVPLGNWIGVELFQNGPNRDAIGAQLSVKIGNRTITKDLQVGGGHASGQIGFVHVGVGVAERAQIRVRWPDGDWSHPYRVFTNNFVRIERGQADAQYWYPE